MTTADKIVIADLLVRAVIGLNDWERETPRDILVNLILYTDVRAAGRSDDPAGILDYGAVTKAVVAYAESSSHYLVEALATAIARICVLGFGADAVVVRVEKPGAVRFARSVGVEIERTRGDFDTLPVADPCDAR